MKGNNHGTKTQPRLFWPINRTIVRSLRFSVGLKWQRAVFRVLWKTAPGRALERATRLLLTPPRQAFSATELAALKEARLLPVPLISGRLVAWRWGHALDPVVLLAHGRGGRGTQLCSLIAPPASLSDSTRRVAEGLRWPHALLRRLALLDRDQRVAILALSRDGSVVGHGEYVAEAGEAEFAIMLLPLFRRPVVIAIRCFSSRSAAGVERRGPGCPSHRWPVVKRPACR